MHMFPSNGQTGSHGASRGNAWLIKIDAGGDIVWDTVFYEDGKETGAFSVQPVADDGYIMAGSIGLGFLEYYDAWLAKTDAEGSMLWNRTFGGKHFDEAYCVQLAGDDGYIVAGTMAGDAWMMKTDPDGNTVPLSS